VSIFVVLLNWNGWKDTVECLDSLFHSVSTNMVVVVCDNASTDASLAHLEAWAAQHCGINEWAHLTRAEVEAGATLANVIRLAIVDNAVNLGFGGGSNVGIRLAMNHPACDYVWLLNNDTAVKPDALTQVWMRMEQDPAIGLCGSTLIYYHDRSKVQAFGGAHYYTLSGRSRLLGAFALSSQVPQNAHVVEAKLSFVVGAAMMVRRAFIEQVGYLQDDYFLYFEEIDWATRGAELFRLGYAPNSIVYHKEGASIGTQPSGGSALSLYYLYRNRVWFTCRFFPACLITVLVACAWDILKMIVKGRREQASAAFRGVLSLSLPVDMVVGS